MKFGLREIVFVLLLMGIPLAAWWLDFRPTNKLNAEIMAEIETRQEKLRQLNRATGTIGDLEREISSLQNAIKFFQSKLPNEKEVDKILQEIWKLAEQNKLATKSIRTQQRRLDTADAAGPHAEQPITVQLEGDFQGFYAFLLALENQPRIMRISQMRLKKLQKASEGQIQATFEMSIFFEKSGKD
ncbi:MAG TPA: hypothetical protein DCX07_02695 [Phycisphaerales bacterium]|nr:hypothetical protein [Phycisphaerales bacterium]